jgi:hypothetical protein
MKQVTLADLNEAGAAARRRGEPYLSNPQLFADADWASIDEMFAWSFRGLAWFDGWLRQDEGRDKDVAAFVRMQQRDAFRAASPGMPCSKA